MTFYLKYRPQTIEDLDITSVRESLSKIVKSKEIPHAFLFAGSKGIGKTSTARITAKVINCSERGDSSEPCNKCDSCLAITNGTSMDVIEMDAASNRGIDDIRALRDIVKLAPTGSKAKVYIIDEAHMLTTEASNALLKTLEEPPVHVYFILATTNPEKLIDTIRSRTTLIQFTKATFEETGRSLSRIVKSEKIKISDEGISKIVKLSKGSFRDAVKLLEQYSKDDTFLDKQDIFEAENLVSLILKRKVDESLVEISKAVKNGIGIENITGDILSLLQSKLIEEKTEELIQLIEIILSVQEYNKVSPIEELPLQLAVIKWCGINNERHEPNVNLSKTIVIEKKEVVKEEKIEVAEEPKKKVENTSYEKLDDISWRKILSEVKPINASIEGLLRSTKPMGMEGNSIKLGVYYKFHKDKLEEQKTKKMLEDVVLNVFGKDIKIDCLLTEAPPKVQLTDVVNKNIITVAEEMFS